MDEKQRPWVNIALNLTLSRRQCLALLTLALLGLPVAQLDSADLTFTTYLPSPVGSYNMLTSRGQTLLAREGGGVGIGTTAPGVYNGQQMALDVGPMPPQNGNMAADDVWLKTPRNGSPSHWLGQGGGSQHVLQAAQVWPINSDSYKTGDDACQQIKGPLAYDGKAYCVSAGYWYHSYMSCSDQLQSSYWYRMNKIGPAGAYCIWLQ